MKIKTKLALEVIVLVSLIGMVSFIALINTKQVQDSFVDLSSETLPTLDTLKDMRYATTQLTSTTMEIVLIEDESRNVVGTEFSELEEDLELNFFEIEQSKFLFNQAFSRYSALMTANYPEDLGHTEKIAGSWNDLISTANKMVRLKTAGASGTDVLKLKNDFETAHILMNNALDDGVAITASDIDERQAFVESLVDNTTWTILISLNLFVAAALGIRYFILKSISNPLLKLRQTAHAIAKGEFIRSDFKGNDEISELGRDIDKMSKDLKQLNNTIITNERLSSIGNLASRLAHDLRNPLSVIKNSIELLNVKLDPIMDEKTSHQLARVGRAISRMSHQIDDVLDYVNVSELQLELHSLSTVIESSVLNTNVPPYVKVNFPKSSSTVNCDAYKLEVAFSNIVNNAVQAINGDGEVTFRVTDKDDEAIVEIEDSGPGIPESALPQIFEPLFTTKQVGTGLGLASCKSIFEKHGGTISVSNNPTTFTIHLPKNPPIEPENTKKSEETESKEGNESNRSLNNTNKLSKKPNLNE
jgi:signal transduction histidine kinase